MRVVPIVLAGGIGTRLWPVSHFKHPKQFLSLIDENTLLQNTLQLICAIPGIAPSIIICNAAHRFIAAEQALKVIKPSAILLESSSHGTAAAVLLAAFYAAERFHDPILLIQPSDSYIKDTNYFCRLVQSSLPTAAAGKIVTFGVKPTEIHTGYGYIKAGDAFEHSGGYRVEKFVEKPSAQLAESYLQTGQYYWNSGIFLFKTSTILREAQKYTPDLLKICESAVRSSHSDPDFVRFDMSALGPSFNLSLDHGIMQETREAVVFPFHSEWADIGDWNRVWLIAEKDKNNNLIKGEVVATDTQDCYIHSQSRLIVTIGIKNQVIIETPEAILIADIREGQRIKEIVNQVIKGKNENSDS